MKLRISILLLGILFIAAIIGIPSYSSPLIHAVGPACVVMVPDKKANPLAIVKLEGVGTYAIPRYAQQAKFREATNGGYTDFSRRSSTKGEELCKRDSYKILRKMGFSA